MQKFISIRPGDIKDNPFLLVGNDWMLITAGDEKGYNMMTASWGMLGVLWNKHVATVFIRPQRYTREFVEKEQMYTLNFFGQNYRSALNVCGTKSGRDIDKAKETGLTPVFDEGCTYFEQARLVLVCKKLYVSRLNPEGFLNEQIDENYAAKDYHHVYVGEVVKALVPQK